MDRRELAIICFLVLAAAAAQLGYWHESADDSYITYRYARNIAEGRGWAYNEGERVSGSTSPLWTLLLALAAKFHPNLVSAAMLFSAILYFLTALISYMLLRGDIGEFPALTAGILSMVGAVNVGSAGLEMSLLLCLGVASLLLYILGRTLWAACAMALMILTRADAAVLALVLTLDYVIRRRRLPWREALLTGLLILPWFVFSRLYFGSPLPHTLQAKAAQLESGFWHTSYSHGAWKLILNGLRKEPMLFIAYPLAAAGLFKRSRIVRIVLLWGVIYFISYCGLRVPAYRWYYLIPVYCLGVTAASGVSALLERCRERLFAAALLVLILGASALLYPLAPLLRASARAYIDRRLHAAPQSHPPAFYYDKADEILERARASCGIANPSVSIAAAALAAALVILRRRRERENRLWALFLCGALLLPRVHSHYQATKDFPLAKMLAYARAGEWLRRNAPPRSNLAAAEIGAVGYYSGMKIIDLAGLVTPDVAEDLASGDRTAWLYRYHPDFVLLQGLWIFEDPVEELSYFARGYEKIRSWPRGDGLDVRLFRRMHPYEPSVKPRALLTMRRWDFKDATDAGMWRIVSAHETQLAGVSARGYPVFRTSGDDSSIECKPATLDPSRARRMKIRMRIRPCRRCRKAGLASVRWREGEEDPYLPHNTASFSTKGDDVFRDYVIDLAENRAWGNARSVSALRITPTDVEAEIEYESVEIQGVDDPGTGSEAPSR